MYTRRHTLGINGPFVRGQQGEGALSVSVCARGRERKKEMQSPGWEVGRYANMDVSECVAALSSQQSADSCR